MKLTVLPFLATVISVAESSNLRSLDKFTDDADNRMLGELDDLTAVLASDEETEGRRLCDKKAAGRRDESDATGVMMTTTTTTTTTVEAAESVFECIVVGASIHFCLCLC